MTYQLIQTEKSYNLQQQNYYVIAFSDKTFQPNKIQVTQILAKDNLDVLDVKVINTYKKSKFKGKKRNVVKQIRPKKYYVKLAQGQSIQSSNENQQ